jgi:inorganic pyrophosphatase
VQATVIGNMQMVDTGEKDDKIIAVASKDPSVNHISSLEEMPRHFMSELRNFFEQYKVLEEKQVQIQDFQNREAAYSIINEAIAYYKEKYA